jgi:DNA (cytosine-5)-methyltransferase 1
MADSFDFIDLFAGIGGMRIAFEGAGGRCVFSSEWDTHAQETYAANFGEVPHGDISEVDLRNIPKFEVLLAGFPCQPFSSIGKRQGFEHPTQGTLFYEIVRIIEAKKPDMFLLENVAGLQSHDQGRTLQIILDTLEELKYDVNYKRLNSADFGVPQFRERIYLVGKRRHRGTKFEFQFPQGRKKHIGIGKFIETGVEGYGISKHLQGTYIYKIDDGRPQIVTPDSDFPVKTLVSTYHKIQRLTGTFVADGPTDLRLLTVNECKAIMGFPKSFKVPVSRTQMYRQFGNSVAVPVVRAIAKEMAKNLDAKS